MGCEEKQAIYDDIKRFPKPQQSFILGIMEDMTARKGLEQPTDAPSPA